MDYLSFPILILVGAILFRMQKLQDDINAVKTQNEQIIKALQERADRPTTAPDNSGEEIL